MKKIVISLLVLTLFFLSGCTSTKVDKTLGEDEINKTVNIEVLTDSSTVDFDKLVLKDSSDSVDKESIQYDLSNVKFDELGNYVVSVSFKDTKGNNHSVDVTVNIVDTTKPNISGTKDYVLAINEAKPDFLNGVTVTDNYDGTITLTNDNVDDSDVDMTKAGTYTVTYTVTDRNNNSNNVDITVTVHSYTITFKPLIIMNGSTNVDFNTYVESIKDDKNTDLSSTFTTSFDTSAINYNVNGTYTLGVTLKDGSGKTVLTKNVDVTISQNVNNYTISYSDSLTCIYNVSCDAKSFVTSIKTADGATVNLADLGLSLVATNVDSTKLGDQTIEFKIVDANNHIVYQASKTINVAYKYKLDLNKETYVNYGNTNVDLASYFTLKDTLTGKIVNTNNLNISISDVNPLNTSDQTVSYIVKDSNDQVLFEKEFTFTVNTSFDIVFKDNLYWDLNNNPMDFDFNDYIVDVVDGFGNSVDITNTYKISVEGLMNLDSTSYNAVDYILYSGDQVLYKESVKITSDFNYYYLILNNLFDIVKINTESVDTYDFESLVSFETKDGITNELPEGCTLIIGKDQVDFNTVGFYQVPYTLMKNDIIEDSYIITVIVTEPTLNLEIGNTTTTTADLDTLDPFSFITKITDLEGNEVTITDTILDEYDAIISLDNGMFIEAMLMDYNQLMYMIESGNNILDVIFVPIAIIDYTEVDMDDHAYIEEGDSEFDFTSLIHSFVYNNTELEIGKDVTINVVNFDASIVDTQTVTIQFLDSEQKVLYEDTITVDVISKNYWYYFEYQDYVVLRANQFTNETFDASQYINSVTNFRDETIDKNLFTYSYEGIIDFTQPGIYTINVKAQDTNNKQYQLYIDIHIFDNFDIIFKNNIIEIPLGTTIDEATLGIEKIIYPDGTDPLNYQITIGDDDVDYYYEGAYPVYIYIETKDTHEVEFIEYLLVIVYNQYEINIPDQIVVDYNEALPNAIDYLDGIYDLNGQNVNLTDLGLSVVTIGDYNSTDLGYFNVMFEIQDSSGNTYARKEVEFIIYSDYSFETHDVECGEIVSDPLELLDYVLDMNTFDYLDLSTNYSVTTLGTIDTSKVGTYPITFILKDSAGTILVQDIIDINVTVPSSVSVDYTPEIFLTVGYDVSTLDIYDYINFITNDTYGTTLTGLGTDFLVDFYTYFIDTSSPNQTTIEAYIYHVDEPYRDLSVIEFTVYIY